MLPCNLTTSGITKMVATNRRRFSEIYSFNGKPGYYGLGPENIGSLIYVLYI